MPFGFPEALGLLRFAWGVGSDLRSHLRRKTPQERLALHLKWKPLFEDYLNQRERQKLRLDVVIRDVRRYDTSTRGGKISGWFKSDLIGTYEKGFMVGLSWESLVVDEQSGDYRRIV
jgi:hypothetical protein